MNIIYASPELIAAAVIPAIVLLVYVNRADRLEKEPTGLILSLVFRGIIATALALYAERLGSAVLDSFFEEGTVKYNVLMYFLVVGCSEEGAKYILMRRRTWNSPEFNCQFDAVVYAVCVSLGFALWENISYSIMYGFGTALVRAITAVPGHACFGVFMGAFYGYAKRYERYGRYGASKRCRRLAFIVPTLIHGTYDFIASLEADGAEWIFIIFIAVLFVISVRTVKKLSKEDNYI